MAVVVPEITAVIKHGDAPHLLCSVFSSFLYHHSLGFSSQGGCDIVLIRAPQ